MSKLTCLIGLLGAVATSSTCLPWLTHGWKSSPCTAVGSPGADTRAASQHCCHRSAADRYMTISKPCLIHLCSLPETRRVPRIVTQGALGLNLSFIWGFICPLEVAPFVAQLEDGREPSEPSTAWPAFRKMAAESSPRLSQQLSTSGSYRTF